jgi:hypothetical protein
VQVVVGSHATAGEQQAAQQIASLIWNLSILSGCVPPTATTTSTTTTVPPTTNIGCGIPFTTYVGWSIMCNQWTLTLSDLGVATSGGISPAMVNIYYNGAMTNSSSIYPPNTVKYDVQGSWLIVNLNQTFAGLYAYQKWAKISIGTPNGQVAGPYAIGQSINIPNVTVANITTVNNPFLVWLSEIVGYSPTPVSTVPGGGGGVTPIIRIFGPYAIGQATNLVGLSVWQILPDEVWFLETQLSTNPPPTLNFTPSNSLTIYAGGLGAIFVQSTATTMIFNATVNSRFGLTLQQYPGSMINGLYEWPILVNASHSATPGTYSQQVSVINTTTGKHTEGSFTIIVKPASTTPPLIYLSPNSLVLNQGSNVTVGINTTAPSVSMYTTKLLYAGLSFGFTSAPGVPTPPFSKYAFYVNVSKSAIPGNYLFAVNAINETTGLNATALLTIQVLKGQNSAPSVNMYASDPYDPYLRYWEIFSKFPGAYKNNGVYANNSALSSALWSGSTMTIPPAYYNSTFYFLITQSGGSAYGSYSGIIHAINGDTPFFGLDVYHALELTLSSGSVISYQIVPIPGATVTPITTVTTTIAPTCGAIGGVCTGTAYCGSSVGACVFSTSDCSTCCCTPTPPSTTTTTVTTTIVPRLNYENFTISFQKGWNLFSIPLAYVAGTRSNSCSKTFASPVWQLSNGQYIKAKFLVGGVGYWIKSNTSCSATIYGPSLNATSLPSLSPGWNLLGALDHETPASSVAQGCSIVKNPRVFNSGTNTYSNSSTLVPGKGYFINIASSCFGPQTPPSIPT